MEFLTPEEKAKLEQRVRDLIANRQAISQRIDEARALGDLRENAEYHSAREQQGLEEAEIRRLEERLKHASIVSHNTSAEIGVVFLGSTVRLRDTDTGRTDLFKLVGEFSDDPPDDYDEVTASSPMGEALMKARVGETIRVNAPRGVKHFKVVEIVA